MKTLPEVKPEISELEQARIKLLNLTKRREAAKVAYYDLRQEVAEQVVCVKEVTERGD